MSSGKLSGSALDYHLQVGGAEDDVRKDGVPIAEKGKSDSPAQEGGRRKYSEREGGRR